ncbi:hypothetical protein [Brevibacillus daliensis]|uniref:hypothetical protein n=1 Tax=Brevibacillus daliensis TaxID=2892995 RepID=UPI001E54B6BE|nr:hypothetical protein [Brevibacillus daliensis]
MAKNTKKKQQVPSNERVIPQMKVVTHDVCLACKTPCERGLAYAKRMQLGGQVGYGVPCILTRR